MAFFIDASWADHPKRGSYTLTIEKTGEPAAKAQAVSQPGLSKQKRTGATLGVVQNVNWSNLNSSLLGWPSVYTSFGQLISAQTLPGNAWLWAKSKR